MDQSTPPHLSVRQRRVLWLLSQGHDAKGVADLLRTHKTSIRDSALSARRKLGCRTTVQGVLVAYQLGVIGDHEDCGSRLSYLRHLDKGEPACPACRRANAEWVDHPAPVLVPLDEVHLRLIRAFHAGRTYEDLQSNWGISRGKLHRLVTETYTRLGVSGLHREERRAAALKTAQGLGLLRRGPVSQERPEGAVQPLGLTEEMTLRSLAEGRTLSEAAVALGVTRTVVSSRLHIIYRKLAVLDVPDRNRRRAAIKAARDQGYVL